jgi:hypothetical protein
MIHFPLIFLLVPGLKNSFSTKTLPTQQLNCLLAHQLISLTANHLFAGGGSSATSLNETVSSSSW